MEYFLKVKYENKLINLKLISPINNTSLTIIDDNRFVVNEYFSFKSICFDLYNIRTYNDMFKGQLVHITELNLTLNEFYNFDYLPNKNKYIHFRIANPHLLKEYKLFNYEDKINELIEL